MTTNNSLFNFFESELDSMPKYIQAHFNAVKPILLKAIENPYSVTHIEAMQLLNVYKCSYHDSGKIEDIMSLDSSCHGCTFCNNWRELAKSNKSIICGYCYDYRQENYRKGVLYRHALNLLIMSLVLFSEDELGTLPTHYIVRINSSGDIENVTHARNMIRYAKTHVYSHVALWSKNFKACEQAFDIEGKPINMTFVASSPIINKAIKAPKYADYVFTVYNDIKALQEALKNGACECNGKKCKECGFKCYLNIWRLGSNIAELLKL